MTVQKVTYSRSLQALPSNFCDIPTPWSFIVNGINDAIVPNSLRDGATNFPQKGVKVGDIVYNPSQGTGATVIDIVDNNTLLLNTDLYPGDGEDYFIYGGFQNTLSNQGCVLYSPGGGNTLSFITIGGDIITSQVFVDTLVPIQVKRLLSATAPVYALW